MAIIGCGGMAGVHGRRLKNNPDVLIVALCDISPERLNSYIDRNLSDYPSRPAIFTEPEQMFVQTRPDAVTVVSPHTAHYEHGMMAIRHGCHVLMEKPMVTNSVQAHELSAAVAQSGKVFAIGYNTPATSEYQYLRELIRRGELGRLELVSAWYVQNWKNTQAGTWRQDPALSGGGQLYDSGAHLLNSLVWTIEQPVSQVQAFIDNQDTRVDINGTINIRFANGVMATVVIGGNCTSAGGSITYAFEKGRVEIASGAEWFRVYRNNNEQVEDLPIQAVAGASSAANSTGNFIDAILGRATALTSTTNGVIQSELMDAIYESARTGAVVTVQRKV
jgi:predicted dehydrogenase